MSSFDPAGKPSSRTWLHFAGIAGSGMSALAQFHAFSGGLATGSDRSFDQGQRPEVRRLLTDLGVVIIPQDGSFVQAGGSGRRCDAVVASTAVEDRVPDIKKANEVGVPILHRSELLAHYVSAHRTIAISGTSGKSTVTAMVFSILRHCGRRPALLTGGAVEELMAQGLIGNSFRPEPEPEAGHPDLLVIEADESDGSLVRYHPWAAVVLNLGLDHKKPAEIMAMFRTLKSNTQGPFLLGDQDNLRELRNGAVTFGAFRDGVDRIDFLAEDIRLSAQGSTFAIKGVPYQLPVPGLYNVTNAAAAVAACSQTGVSLAEMVPALRNFQGVQRRFQWIGQAGGVGVIDDFAHNPDKISAALTAARLQTNGRILAVFQPHGFGPTRFLKKALIETFARELQPEDILWLPEIYFAGGTVQKDISSRDLARAIVREGRQARFSTRREQVVPEVVKEAVPGDLVLVMGARDPSLTSFCRRILAGLEKRDQEETRG